MRSVVICAASAFYRSSIGKNKNSTLGRLFNPLFSVPPSITSITPVQRSFLSSLDHNNFIEVEDYHNPTGLSKSGYPETMSSGVSILHSQVMNIHSSV